MRHRNHWLGAIVLIAAATTAGAQAPTCNKNGFGADQLTLTVPIGGTDFDLGWKGKYHDLEVPGGARFELCLVNCDTTTDSLCDVEGYVGDQSAAGRAFSPPIPAIIGTVSVCIVTTFKAPFATGTADIATGDIDVTANISGDVYLNAPSSTTNVCPRCSGANPGDTGTCVGGVTPGAACTTSEVVTVQGATDNPYPVSRQCLPAGSPLSTTFPVHVTTGTSTIAGLCTGQTTANDCSNLVCGAGNCTGGSGNGISQNCCATNTSKRCFPDPLSRFGMASPPSFAWPDLVYPKTGPETLVASFCAPGVPGLLGLAVNSDVGLPGPATFILPVDGSWALDPTPTTTTLVTTTTIATTTTTGAATTTTTLPGCTSGLDCSDGDPCTDDECNAGTCSNPPTQGPAGVDCQLAKFGSTDPCPGETLDAGVAAALTQFIAKARAAIQAIPAATPKKAAKLEKKAGKALKTLGKKIAKAAKKGKISTVCEATLGNQIAALRLLVSQL